MAQTSNINDLREIEKKAILQQISKLAGYINTVKTKQSRNPQTKNLHFYRNASDLGKHDKSQEQKKITKPQNPPVTNNLMKNILNHSSPSLRTSKRILHKNKTLVNKQLSKSLENTQTIPKYSNNTNFVASKPPSRNLSKKRIKSTPNISNKKQKREEFCKYFNRFGDYYSL